MQTHCVAVILYNNSEEGAKSISSKDYLPLNDPPEGDRRRLPLTFLSLALGSVAG